MYGPTVRRKRFFVELAMSGLASMYPTFDWSVLCSGHHGYQRACDLITGQASTGPFGSPVFAKPLAGQEHGRTIPLADTGIDPKNSVTSIHH